MFVHFNPVETTHIAACASVATVFGLHWLARGFSECPTCDPCVDKMSNTSSRELPETMALVAFDDTGVINTL